MGIYVGNSGSVGGTGALTVDNDYIFADATERDAYFVSNPSELVEDLYVSTGGTLEKYVGSSWVDMSALIKGSTGQTGNSAYEVALNNGFVGTEAAWLASLQGTTVDNAMSDLIYDPQGIKDDIYDRANHTGAQDINTITGLQTDLDSRALGSDLSALDSTVGALSTEVGTKLNTSVYTDLSVKTKYESNTDTNAFTDAFKTKLSGLTERFKGVFADSASRDVTVTSPVNGDYCKQTDTNSFWFYGSGTWIDTGDTSTGDMTGIIYDPQSIGGDVFDRGNHTGTQAISTVLGLQSELDPISGLITDVANLQNDIHDPSTGLSKDVNDLDTNKMGKADYDPQGIEGDVYDRSNHTGTQTKSTIDNLEDDLDDINAKIASYPVGELFTLGVLDWNVQNVTGDISITPRGFKYSNPTLSNIEFVDTTTSLDYNTVTISNYLPTLETGQFCELIFVNAHGTERDNREFATTTMSTGGGQGWVRVFSGDNGIWSSNDQGIDEQRVYVEIKCIIS